MITTWSNILKSSDEGWWMTTNTSFPFKVSSRSRSITFSESREANPEVGSSRKRMAGSRISSRAILSRFRCPPLMVLFITDPTLRSFFSRSPRFIRVSFTFSLISLLLSCLKQNLALYQRFSNTVSSSISRSSWGTNPETPFKAPASSQRSS